MPKEYLKNFLKMIPAAYSKRFKDLGWKMITTAILTMTAAVTFVAYAAFTEPTTAPSASNQDFSENILGANNADNAFGSASVAANADGSLIERLEYMQGLLDLPAEANVKSGTAFGIENTGSLTPVSGSASALDAAASDVVAGKIFFGAGDTDWTPTVGTYEAYAFYASQTPQAYDDYNCANNNGESNTACGAGDAEYTGEEAEWTLYTDGTLGGANVASGKVYKDNRSGLYWSDCYDASSGGGSCDTRTNSFTIGTGCSDADINSGTCLSGEYKTLGEAITFCENLSLAVDGTGDKTDWHLPSQKELMQAYIDGAANNVVNPADYYWSGTEDYTDSANAWLVNLSYGSTYTIAKSNATYARCVRR